MQSAPTPGIPFLNYGDIWLQTHGGYANYNSLQVSAQKQSGNLFLFTNFTFGKVLGTRDGSTSNGNGNGPVVNPFDLGANYGPLEYDHTKTYNLSFSYKLPKPIHNNWALGEIVNGWQLSNYTTYEDGAPYQTTSPNMNMNYQQYHTAAARPSTRRSRCPFRQRPRTARVVVAGNQTYGIGTNHWLGSSQYENGHPACRRLRSSQGTAEESVLQPQLLCSAASANSNVVRSKWSDNLAVYPHAALLWQRLGDLQGIPGYGCPARRNSHLGDQLAQSPERAIWLGRKLRQPLLFNGLSSASS